MKHLSIWSIVFAIIGVILFSCSYVFTESFEFLMIMGFVFLVIGSLFCFGAMFKREKGVWKFLSVGAFFILSFAITWSDPFQVLRLITWIKN